MIKVSDYIVKRLAEYGIEHAFIISGGGSMHLNDSFGRSKDIAYICNHHEQASAMAAEGYARASGKPAVVVVTSGPGGTNTLTGVLGQWLDSVPVLYLSGQVKRQTMGAGIEGLRQLGDQEINIIDIVKPVTKFAEAVKKPEDIGYLLDEALYTAISGRPGPAWLDIPLDVQAASIYEALIGHFGWNFSAPSVPSVAKVIELLKQSERPLFLVGHGIRISGAQKEFLEFVEQTGIPVVTSMNGMDLIPSDHSLYAGRIGTIGTRSGNHALQNCDLLISIGSRNNIRQVSYDWANFAPKAKKIVVDIDDAELRKPTVKPDIAIHADAGAFLNALKESLSLHGERLGEGWSAWLSSCRSFFAPPVPQRGADYLIDPYHFVSVLTTLLPEDAVIVSGNGTASVCLFQAGKVKAGQRVIMNSGCASMGYDLPAAIGACIANGQKEVICITGDGSIQMNIQELQTIAHYNFPIKIFVLNNNGYHSIRQTQDNYFEGRHAGAGPDSGVSCPDITKIAKAYGFKRTFVANSHNNLEEFLSDILNADGPVVCDVHLTPDYKFDKQNLFDFLTS